MHNTNLCGAPPQIIMINILRIIEITWRRIGKITFDIVATIRIEDRKIS